MIKLGLNKKKCCDKTGLKQEGVLVGGVSSPFVNSHLNINNLQDSGDKIIKHVSFLTADVNDDVYSFMSERTAITKILR